MSIKDRESLVSTLLGHNQESLQDVLKWQKLFRKAVDDLVAEQLQPFFNHHGLWGQTLSRSVGSDPVYCFRSNSSIRSRSFFFDLDPEIAFWARRIKLLTLSGCDRPNAVASSRSVAVVRRWAR